MIDEELTIIELRQREIWGRFGRGLEQVTGLLLDRGGNVETSRMARLGGEFAILMLVSLPSESLSDLERDLEALTALLHENEGRQDGGHG